MDDRETILGVLRALAARLWRARVLRDCAFTACIALFCALCARLAFPSLYEISASAAGLAQFALAGVLLLAISEMLVRAGRPVGMAEAANEADRRANLYDELKSAHWFAASGTASEAEALHLARAAATARGLDVGALVPRVFPRGAWAAAAIATLLAIVMETAPQSMAVRDAREGDASAAVERDALQALLESPPDTPEMQKLATALEELRRDASNPQQRARALAEARDAIDQANMEASSAREEMARFAQVLRADPKFEGVANAMVEGRLAEAKNLLHDLQAKATAPPGMEDMRGADSRAATSDPARPGDAQDVRKSAALNQDALERVEKAIAQAEERIETQNRVNAIKRRMEDGLVVTSQRSQLTAGQFDKRSPSANPTPSPEAGNADIRGGTLFRQAAIAREEADESRDGSQTGDASGDSVAAPLEGQATPRLAGQLKLEAILQKREPGDEAPGNGDTGWFYAASREEKSQLRREDVALRDGYDRDAATEHDRVPAQRKRAVKNYFLNLHEGDTR